MRQCHILMLLFVFTTNTLVIGDVIFTSERCNRATYGLRTVNGDPTRYKQCGPSGRVWIVPCAPLMTFDPQDRVCKERTDVKVLKPMRKYELPTMIITTPAPHPSLPAFSPPSSTSSEIGIEAKAPAEEFVFSTVRPKRPRVKARTRSKNKKTTVAMAETTTIPSIPTTTPKMIIFGGKKNGGPAFTRPGRVRTTTPHTTTTTTTTPQPIRQVTHATKFVPIIMQRTTGMPMENIGMPHTLAPYEKQEKRNEEEMGYGEEKLTTMMPEYTVRYNGKVMTENQFLSQLLHIVQHQKAVAERQQQNNFNKMEQDRLQQEKEERDREIERRRRIEEAERERLLEIEKQAAIFAEQERLAMEREREVERIRQEERRREMEMRRQEEVERQMERQREMERVEMERKRKNERIRLEIEAEMKQKELEMERQRELERQRQMEYERQKEMERRRQQEEEEQERLIKLRKEKADREKAIMEEQQRREMEEKRRKEKEMMEKMEMEEKRRQIAEERAQLENIEKERQMLRQLIENERIMSNQQSVVTQSPPPPIKPIYRPPPISEYQPPEVESQMIRFTTQSPEWVTSSNSWRSIDNWNTVEVEEREPKVFQGCLINGECELKYDYDYFCQHPTNPSKYLQCAPLYGRNGRWTERQCPDTLEFVVSLGRCEKSASDLGFVRKPYDPDNRVIIPRLPSETSFIQWTGNRVIDSNQNPQPPRVYPPIPETHQPHIYNTIDEFPRDLLPTMPESPSSYTQEYQNHIRGSVISHTVATAPPMIPASYRIPQSVPEVDNSLKSEIDLSHIHPLFPRVQPNFLSRIIPGLNLKLQDDNGNQSLGSFMKPVIKEIALNQTEMFLDRLLADEAVRKLLENEKKDRLKSSNTPPN